MLALVALANRLYLLSLPTGFAYHVANVVSGVSFRVDNGACIFLFHFWLRRESFYFSTFDSVVLVSLLLSNFGTEVASLIAASDGQYKLVSFTFLVFLAFQGIKSFSSAIFH